MAREPANPISRTLTFSLVLFGMGQANTLLVGVILLILGPGLQALGWTGEPSLSGSGAAIVAMVLVMGVHSSVQGRLCSFPAPARPTGGK